jgi:hypothetical protein
VSSLIRTIRQLLADAADAADTPTSVWLPRIRNYPY